MVDAQEVDDGPVEGTAGLIAWWPGDGDATDRDGTADGAISGTGLRLRRRELHHRVRRQFPRRRKRTDTRAVGAHRRCDRRGIFALGATVATSQRPMLFFSQWGICIVRSRGIRRMVGAIDDVRLYDRALAAADLAALAEVEAP